MLNLKSNLENKYGKKKGTIIFNYRIQNTLQVVNALITSYRLLKDDKNKHLGDNQRKIEFISLINSYAIILVNNVLVFWLKHKDNNYEETKKLSVDEVVNEILK